MPRLPLSASAMAMRAAEVGACSSVATSADSGPIEIPALPCSVPAGWSPRVTARLIASQRIGLEHSLCSRTSTVQLPPAGTVSCWMLALGSDTRRTGPLLHAASIAAAVAARKTNDDQCRRMPAAPVARWDTENTTAYGVAGKGVGPAPRRRLPAAVRVDAGLGSR